MNKRNVIGAALLVAILLSAGCEWANAQSAFEKKFDSLFVIAASGAIKYQDMTGPAMDSIAAMGVDVVPLLIDKFTTRSARERWTIIWIFQRIGSPAVPFLVRALQRDDDLVVPRVCWALGDIKDTAATLPLVEITRHHNWQARDEAVGALGKIGDRRASDAVMAGLSDSVGQVRKSAVVSCGQLGLQSAARPLVHALNDNFYGTRLTAVNSLLQLDTALVLEIVSDSLKSPSQWVGHLGCYILGEIGTDAALALLLEQTASADPVRRAWAAEAIIKADPLDNCSFRQKFVPQETDPLVRLRIQAALASSQDEKEQP